MNTSDSGSESYKLLEDILVLKKSRLFGDVPTSELRAVVSIVEELSFTNSDIIVKEGDVGDSLYLIKEGGVRITKRLGTGESVDLAKLSVGECFGEMAAIDEEVRSASAVACGDSTVLLRIGKDDLLDVVLDFPNIGIELLRIFVQRLRSANSRIEALSADRMSAH